MPTSISTNVPLVNPNLTGEEALVHHTINNADRLKSRKEPWNDQYQLLGEFIHMRKQEFQSEHTAGEFLTREIFDPAGPKAAKTAASTLTSLLWPQTKNRIKLTPPDTLEGRTDEKEYYEFVTKQIMKVFDDPKANFGIATDEYMLDQVVFGTSGVDAVADEETKVRFTPWGVKHISIDEGKDGKVDTVYIEREMRLQQLAKEYGLDKLSAKSQEEFKNGKVDTEKCLLIAIEPRSEELQKRKGNKGKPFSALHIEKGEKHLINESGFNEMPMKVTRFTKLIGEVYGRSLGMDALPDILQSNAVWESTTVAIEKSLDPPLGVYSDGVLGGGEIDTSAGAINVFNPSDQAKDRQPIFPLFTVGEFKQIVALLQDLNERISDHFLIDRLLDFNNETRMTATETAIRDRMRSATLGQVLNRQIASYFTPMIERVFNILLEKDHLGVPENSAKNDGTRRVIPKTITTLMKEGEDVFDINYFTPAMRIMQAEEAEGILRQAELAGTYAQIGLTDALDTIEVDANMDIYSNIVGAPSEGMTSKQERKQVRDERKASVKQSEEAEQGKALSEGIRNIGQSGLVETEAPKRNE